jgi:GntR family transcriptional regulator/MocR family aminotransferase
VDHGLGLDLLLDISTTRPGRHLGDSIREAIREGRLAAGTRLPAIRTLAGDLGIARSTVSEVYGQLAAEGWIESRTGSGTWVADRPSATSPTEPTVPQRVTRGLIDMRGGRPDATTFPRREWIATVRRVTLGAAADDFGYVGLDGVPALRRAVVDYVGRTRGVVGRDAVIGHGTRDLLGGICRVLRARGARSVAVEQYGQARHPRLIAATGLQPLALEVDAAGVVVSSIGRADAVLVTPTHQFPLGVPLSPDRRRSLVNWAERTGGLVLEDDYDGEFRFDQRPVGALQALAPERVVYLGSASKALAPGLGIAWAVAPSWLRDELVEDRRVHGIRPAALEQLALAEFFESYLYDRHVRRMRAIYRRRRKRLEQVVTTRLPGCEITSIEAGLQCLLRLPAGSDESAVTAEAYRRGLLVRGLAEMRWNPDLPLPQPSLVVGYGAPAAREYETALRRLVASVRTVAGDATTR